MRVVPMTRRQLIAAAAAGGTSVSIGERCAWSAPDQRFDFTRPLDDWTTVSGKWAIEEVSGASQGGRALVQRATENEFNVIVAPGGPYENIDVSVRFKPMSGREDASAGIVFRFSEGHRLRRTDCHLGEWRLTTLSTGNMDSTTAISAKAERADPANRPAAAELAIFRPVAAPRLSLPDGFPATPPLAIMPAP